MGWAGGGSADAIGRDIYMHIHLLLEKRSSQFLRPYVATWTAIHPSIHPSIRLCILYLVSSRILYLTAAAADRSDCHRN